MNIKKLLVLAPVAVLSLTSCGKTGVRHETEEYFVQTKHASFNALNGLKVLQLTDLHLGTNCDRQVQYAFIQKTIDMASDYCYEVDKHAAKPDLIVISGDVFTFGTKEIVKDFCQFMDKQEIDWTLTFGNHDEQCYFSIDWLTGYLNNLSSQESSYLLFNDHQDDDVFGNANFVINVPDESEDKDNERIFIFDSNRYRYEIGSYGYDCIHNDQIDWYERCVRYDVDESKSEPTSKFHSLAFFHIPFSEFETFYDKAKANTGATFVTDEKEGTDLDIKRENVSCPKMHTNLYDKMDKLGSTKGVFVGHDHKNNYSVQVQKNDGTEGMILSYGVKGTDTVYADDDLMGGQVITVKKNKAGSEGKKSITIHPVLHTYKQLKEGE